MNRGSEGLAPDPTWSVYRLDRSLCAQMAQLLAYCYCYNPVTAHHEQQCRKPKFQFGDVLCFVFSFFAASLLLYFSAWVLVLQWSFIIFRAAAAKMVVCVFWCVRWCVVTRHPPQHALLPYGWLHSAFRTRATIININVMHYCCVPRLHASNTSSSKYNMTRQYTAVCVPLRPNWERQQAVLRFRQKYYIIQTLLSRD